MSEHILYIFKFSKSIFSWSPLLYSTHGKWIKCLKKRSLMFYILWMVSLFRKSLIGRWRRYHAMVCSALINVLFGSGTAAPKLLWSCGMLVLNCMLRNCCLLVMNCCGTAACLSWNVMEMSNMMLAPRATVRHEPRATVRWATVRSPALNLLTNIFTHWGTISSDSSSPRCQRWVKTTHKSVWVL